MYLQNLISLSLTGCLWLAHSRELYYYRNAHADAQIALTQRVLSHLELLFRQRIIPIQQVVAQSPATARPAAQAPCLAETDATHIKISQVLPPTHLRRSSVSAPERIAVNVLPTSLFTSTPFAANGMQEKRTAET